MLGHLQTSMNSMPVIPVRQGLRGYPRSACWIVVVATLFVGKVTSTAETQLYDSLDAHPPRWSLDSSDCDARILEHKHLADGGVDGRACETISFMASHGSEAILAYPIEPVRAIDDLNASLSLMSVRKGARIGFRVRYPYARDKETKRPLAAKIFGSSYTDAGEFQKLGVGAIEKALQLKTVAVRQEQGVSADLGDPYVDAIIINAYAGVGSTSLRIDELNVSGMIPMGKSGHVPRSRSEASFAKKQALEQRNRVSADGGMLGNRVFPQDAFPTGKVTKVLQHNGEPLAWVRSLGFDGVLLANPPTASILREAIQSRMMVYAPPPTAPDPDLQSLLEPISAWYIGSGLSLDRSRVDQTAITTDRLRLFPDRWQRPIIAAPTEAWRDYAPLVDAMIDDLPHRIRNITAGEEVAETMRTFSLANNQKQLAIGINTMPPERALQQAELIARSIAVPQPRDFRWHSMWLQAMRSFEANPSAILFRSTRSLSSGSDMDSQRAMALSYVNRVIAMIAPWVSGAKPAPPPEIVGSPYRCGRLQIGDTDLLILSSTAMRGNEVLAGDGAALEILLPPEDSSKNVWRLTHFSAERVSPDATETGTRVQIVSPDVVEIIVVSGEPSVGAKLASSAARFAQQAGMDRWQLTRDLVSRTRQYWSEAIAASATRQRIPTGLLSVAARTLAEAEPLFQAGDVTASLRMARRADAWALRSSWQLSEALMPDWPNPTSSPPIQCGAAPVQIAWQPLMHDTGWGKNRMTTGSLDRADVFGANRWTFGRRLNSVARSNVNMVSRGVFAGAGALRASVASLTDDPLSGGYEGTAVQIGSPSVKIAGGTAFRIDAMVRTLGFGGPHQGVLVYDTIGGQEMGVLVRGQSTWTPVRLYRQTADEQDVKVMFEVIGAGEAVIDEVKLQIWEPKPKAFIPMRPIAELPADEFNTGDQAETFRR